MHQPKAQGSENLFLELDNMDKGSNPYPESWPAELYSHIVS